MSEDLVKFGKTANAVLRHDARKLELDIRPDGYMRVQDVVCTNALPPLYLIIKLHG